MMRRYIRGKMQTIQHYNCAASKCTLLFLIHRIVYTHKIECFNAMHDDEVIHISRLIFLILNNASL